MHRPVLPRAVEGKHVVAALYCGTCAFGMHFLSRTVETGMDDEQRTLAPRVVDAMEISGKPGVLIGNLDRFNGRIVQSTARLIAGDGFLVGAVNPWIVRVSVQEELRDAVVGCRAQKAVSRADVMASRQLLAGFVGYSLAGRIPFVVPAVEIAGDNAGHRGKNLTELAAAIAGAAERSLGLVPELQVVREERGRRCGGFSRHVLHPHRWQMPM